MESALRELRGLPETRLGMQCWVDILCVDQSNGEERNHQVKLTKDIYTKACAAVAWLGGEVSTDDKAID